MVYAQSFSLTGDLDMIDPISIQHHNNDQAIIELDDQEGIDEAQRGFMLGLESWDVAIDTKLALESAINNNEKISGGLLTLVNNNLKIIKKKGGVSLDPLPALESINDGSRRDFTIALENVVTETLGGIWTTIKNFFLSIHKKVKDWYLKAWDGSVRLSKQAEVLKGKAEGLTTAPKETSIELSGSKALSIQNRPANPQQIVSGVTTINQVTSAILTQNPDDYTNLFPKFEKATKVLLEQARNMKDSDGNDPTKKDTANPKYNSGDAFGSVTQPASSSTTQPGATGTGDTNALIADLNKVFEAMCKSAGIDGSTKVTNDKRYTSTDVEYLRAKEELLGGKMLIAIKPLDITNITTDVYFKLKQAFKVSVDDVSDQPKEMSDPQNFQTATAQQIIAICDSTISSCEMFFKFKMLYDQRNKATENLTKQLDSFVSGNSNLKGSGALHVKNSISTTLAIVKGFSDTEVKWARYSMQTLNKAIAYCRSSISQY